MAPLAESRASETVGAAAARRDSRSRAAREWRGTAAEEEEEEGNGVTRRGGRCGSEVESAVGVAMEAGRSGASAAQRPPVWACAPIASYPLVFQRGNRGDASRPCVRHGSLNERGPLPPKALFGIMENFTNGTILSIPAVPHRSMMSGFFAIFSSLFPTTVVE
jgi:hypothetical protein